MKLEHIILVYFSYEYIHKPSPKVDSQVDLNLAEWKKTHPILSKMFSEKSESWALSGDEIQGNGYIQQTTRCVRRGAVCFCQLRYDTNMWYQCENHQFMQFVTGHKFINNMYGLYGFTSFHTSRHGFFWDSRPRTSSSLPLPGSGCIRPRNGLFWGPQNTSGKKRFKPLLAVILRVTNKMAIPTPLALHSGEWQWLVIHLPCKYI